MSYLWSSVSVSTVLSRKQTSEAPVALNPPSVYSPLSGLCEEHGRSLCQYFSLSPQGLDARSRSNPSCPVLLLNRATGAKERLLALCHLEFLKHPPVCEFSLQRLNEASVFTSDTPGLSVELNKCCQQCCVCRKPSHSGPFWQALCSLGINSFSTHRSRAPYFHILESHACGIVSLKFRDGFFFLFKYLCRHFLLPTLLEASSVLWDQSARVRILKLLTMGRLCNLSVPHFFHP